ncbi:MULTISPECIES: hypothetical protein [unclassified Neptuniibacter]|uniref:hypothetical protein n=1 Tax=unclassified Neptuniibacter TaxID=2630693 RepID=UPI000C5AF5CE|nr:MULTISPECIES: hypothetical protein [unclassified Neptuniibacter]MAY41704.1 hypothetical protein [Oceanospirillaceae bacterium]|tara:strand:- start:9766 stop:10059 length:294 start_codon:yes stop_codon:yes gene_type:complete
MKTTRFHTAEKKTATKTVHLTDKEAEDIMQIALEAGFTSLSPYLRYLVCSDLEVQKKHMEKLSQILPLDEGSSGTNSSEDQIAMFMRVVQSAESRVH